MENPLILMRLILGGTSPRGNRRLQRARRLCLALCAALLGVAGTLPGQALEFDPGTIFPVNEVRPGLEGYGLTVFQGTQTDTFAVEILGVLKGVGPRADRILFRGRDPVLEKAGIIQGMSGSPIYVDGRLLGAAAFAFPFAQDPIGAITPIEEMLAIWDLPEGRPETEGGDLGLRTPREGGPGDLAAWRALCSRPRAWMEGLLEDGRRQSFPSGLQPIGTPVAMDGWAGAGMDLLEPLFERLGWEPVQAVSAAAPPGIAMQAPPAAGSAAPTTGDPGEIGPGSAVGVRLVGGDANLSAIGTLTLRDGDRILAFGHPMLFAGGQDWPLVGADILSVVPSRQVSFKMGSGKATIGTLVQDQRTGVAARLGREPRTLPVRVSVTDPRIQQATYEFDVVRHQILTPVMVTWAAVNAFVRDLAQAEPATFDLRMQLHLEDGRTLRFRDHIAARQAASTLGAVATQLVTYFLASTFEPFPVTAVEIDARITPGVQRFYVEKLEAERSRVRPGESLRIRVLLREHEGEARWRDFDIPIPQRVLGDRVMILATSLQEFLVWDQERAPEKYVPQDFDHLFTLLEELPAQDQLMIKVYSPSAGALVRGRELGSLPGSVLRTLDDRAAQGTISPVAGFLVHEER
ncbi:MAG: hypothetical protein GF355_15540, partial [Candidatus Eisenbacteria bacterium]|nr:hypothetical protein [Candidatus Eisenbacteria bacterium]